jgi:hypothetical protein
LVGKNQPAFKPASELTFTFKVLGIYFGLKGIENFHWKKRAEEVPVQYTPDEWTDLESLGFLSLGR